MGMARCDMRATVISPPGINATLYSPRRLVCTRMWPRRRRARDESGPARNTIR
jgi:hypothetical protein